MNKGNSKCHWLVQAPSQCRFNITKSTSATPFSTDSTVLTPYERKKNKFQNRQAGWKKRANLTMFSLMLKNILYSEGNNFACVMLSIITGSRKYLENKRTGQLEMITLWKIIALLRFYSGRTFPVSKEVIASSSSRYH